MLIQNVMEVSLGEAVVVTIFSMAVVFVALLIISYLLKGFKVLFYKKKTQKIKTNVAKTVKEKVAVTNEEIIISNDDEEELIAVITAALAASLSKSISEIRIRNIKRVNQGSSMWTRAGRFEQMK